MGIGSARRRKLVGLLAGALATTAVGTAALWNDDAKQRPPVGELVGALDVEQACNREGGVKYVDSRDHVVCERVNNKDVPELIELDFDQACTDEWDTADLIGVETLGVDDNAVVECRLPA